jgi:hypothetical protein
VQLLATFFVFTTLKRGARRSAFSAVIAIAAVGVAALLTGAQMMSAVPIVLMIWLPAFVLATALQRTRSLTLTLQFLALFFVVVSIYVFGVVDGLVEAVKPLSTFYIEFVRASGVEEVAQSWESEPLPFARQIVLSMVWVAWIFFVLFLLVGYRFYRKSDVESRNYGTFSSFDNGRVIAIVLAVLAAIALAAGVTWLTYVAAMMLAPFWLQGLAVTHYFFEAGKFPLFALILIYILMVLPVLNEIAIVALAVVGYLDVWLGIRNRMAANNGV